MAGIFFILHTLPALHLSLRLGFILFQSPDHCLQVLYRLALSLILFAAKLQRFMNICFLLAKSFHLMGQTAQSLCCEAFFLLGCTCSQAKSLQFPGNLLLLSPPGL